MNIVLLLAFIIYIAYGAVTGKREYQDFARMRSTHDRQRFYKRWLWQTWLMGAIAIVALLIIRQPHFITHPILNQHLPSAATGASQDEISAMRTGLPIGLAIGLSITIFRSWRRMKRSMLAVGTVDALLPRNNPERWLGLHTAIAAGINEELLFRAALPALILGITHSTVIAIAVSVIIFGLAHFYQGWKGMLGTAVIGWVFFKLFMLSGTILIPMAFHAGMDAWGLLVVPYVADKAAQSAKRHRKNSAKA